ncbi:hypothetical protein OU416_01470 [Saccharopolyspora indica]|nr:hypothetical protein [Saccharopolyspora indica]MDA3642699.1 hypothetical protein [Saccharopolyspora indica]
MMFEGEALGATCDVREPDDVAGRSTGSARSPHVTGGEHRPV